MAVKKKEVLMNKLNKQTKQKQTRRYRKQTDSCHRGKGAGGLGEKDQGIEQK